MAVMRRQLLSYARSILLGWVALLAITYMLERPLLIWTAPWVGSEWLPTARLGLNCLALASTGWIVGRGYRHAPMWCVGGFAIMLLFWDFDSELGVNIPWLIRLTADALRDSNYLDSLATTASGQLLLFASLMLGGLLSRPRQAPASIAA